MYFHSPSYKASEDQNQVGSAGLLEYGFDLGNSPVQNVARNTIYDFCQPPIYRIYKAMWREIVKKAQVLL